MNVVSYAVDMKITNNDNVEFCAYFVDGDKELTTIDSDINAKDLKMYIEISVKNEGYFNGKINLEDSSFKLNKKYTDKDEFVKNIDESSIEFNQINAGNTAKIEVGIEFKNESNIKLEYLNYENKIQLEGTYKNSKKDIEINGTTLVKTNWKEQENLKAKIGAKLLTNKIYEIGEERKRIVQILVDSKLENDLYPIKTTDIELNVPQGAENVKVHSRSTNATNGNKEFNEENYNYNSETNTLDIKLQNNEKDGEISWIKGKKDSLVVTYIYPENVNIENKQITAQNTITTYSEKEVKAKCEVTIDKEINGVLTSNIKFDETEIYKGKLYTGEKRYYTTSTAINVNYALMDKIEVKEKETVFTTKTEDKKANIQYVQSKINKKEFDEIFGEDGYISILDQENNTVANINKDTQADESGYININYNSGVKAITIKASKPLSEKTLKIYHKKVILSNEYKREEIKEFTGIKEEITNEYNGSNVTTINLKDTSSSARIDASVDTLSTIQENKNVEIVGILETSKESNDLYKNPSVDIVFPKEIKEARILSAKALYRNGLTVENCEKIKNENGETVLHIDFKGEQEKYNSEILNGLEIHIYANLKLDKTVPSKKAKFVMNYTNDNGNKDSYSVSKEIQLESKDGLVLYNSVSDYNKNDDKIETINKEQTTAKLDMNSKVTTAKVETILINNYEDDITKDVVVVGNMPVKKDDGTFNTKISNVKVNSKNAKVYYSTKSDAKENDKSWSEDNTNAKTYKVVLDEIKLGETVKLSYDIVIPAKLSYNEKGILETSLEYSYEEESVSESSNIVFETETAIVKQQSTGVTTTTTSGLEVNVKTSLGNEILNDGDNIYNGETVIYILTVKNNTGKDLKDLNIKVTQTNGVMFELVERSQYNPGKYDGEGCGMEHFWEETTSNTKEFNNINIANGENITLDKYQVVAKKGESAELYGNIEFKTTDETLNESIQTIKNNINDAELKVSIVPEYSEEYIWYRNQLEYITLKIQNMTETELKDIEAQVVLSKELTCEELESYIILPEDGNVQIINKEINSLGETVIKLKIASLAENEVEELRLKPVVKDFEEQTQKAQFYATATSSNGKIYKSNIIEKTLQYGEEESKIDLSQTVKVNGKDVNEETILNNGDKVEFNVTVKNPKDKEVKINIADYMKEYWKDVIIKIIDSTEIDITDKLINNNLTYEYTLGANSEISILISATFDNTYVYDDYVSHDINIVDLSYYNSYNDKKQIKVCKADDGKLNITIEQFANPEDETIIKDGQEVEFKVNLKNTCNYDRKINIADALSMALKDIKVIINGIDVTNKYLSEHSLEISDYTIKANEDVEMIIKAKIDLTNYTLKTITNTVLIKSDYSDLSSNMITYYTSETAKEEPSGEDDTEYVIRGKAWLDTNENGQRDENEESIKELEVKAINTKTQEVIDKSVLTDSDGIYELQLPKGKYIIIFMYNNEDYYITTYHADNVKEDVNSDAISKKMTINGQEVVCGATDEINLISDKENIDIGLILRSKFDFKLDKYISKVVVTNKSGTKTYDLDNTTLGKVEIPAKYLSGSTVLVEYNIKITNIGDVAGSVEKIVDNMPSDMKFNSNSNQDWYKSGNKLVNESLSDKILDKGESAEVKVVLTKEMTDSNTGLFNNTALIAKLNNNDNLKDIDSENNKGSADLMVTVKTGTAMKFSLLIMSFAVCIMVVAYYVTKKYRLYKF